MRNNALVTPQVLIWARERLDLSLTDASEFLKIKPDRLKSWEDGNKYPTIRQAKEVAKKYKIPYVFFFLPESPKNIKLPKNHDYRTFTNLPVGKFSVELKSLLFDIVQRREAMLQLNHELSIDIPSFSFFYDLKTTNVGNIAKTIRAFLQLPEQLNFRTDYEAFNYFRTVIEKIGILVFQAVDIELSEMRGISVFEEIYPIIVVNRNDSPNARIFTLIHELAHIITRTAGICDYNGMTEASSLDVEKRCNQIAAQALVPENALKSHNKYSQLLNNWSDSLVRDIANVFSVSREVILGRLLTFKDINFDFYCNKMEQYNIEYHKNKNSDKKNGFLPPSTDKETQLGKIYISTVLTAYNQDVITARDAIQYFEGLRLKHFQKLERWCFA